MEASSILSKSRVNYKIRLKRNEIITAASIVNSITMQMIITDNYILLTFKLKKKEYKLSKYTYKVIIHRLKAGLKEKKIFNENFLPFFFHRIINLPIFSKNFH